ncbi:isocitrate lyase/PEP mutase family protein [Natronorubrum thiooxidans]|uniref:2-Methylisocitrate lyase, PEP mutase family n=1 Tax=Natronorubrum thiooxidans TaxID=308853 RepID=A0A1N7GYJ4_9EURY|nr:isocitrate lyase/phosphoenolpyruvate mutase family protein [Natronorubrum thiooxidans]SIS17655.1 2-Methylisocitrate lyase, PEP mutase family [Natronorubrum thiooxidans]
MATTDHSLREQLDSDGIVLAPGVADALEGVLAERAGADVLYVSGNAVSSSVHGGPDIGLTTMTEMVTRVGQIAGAVERPVIADADDGYGNALSVHRTIQEFERAGAAGVHIEDQDAPKKCGHFADKTLVSTAEMCGKIRAACDARTNDEFVVIARTDAVAISGLKNAIDRCRSYADAGADMVFIDAPETDAHLEEIGAELAAIPLVINVPYGGKTPLLPADRLEELGYDLMLFATTAQKAKLQVLERVYEHLLETGDERGLTDQLATWETRDAVTDLERWRDLEDRYA